MPSRDPLEQRQHIPLVPRDLNDPARPMQLLETSSDALVETLRAFFASQGLTVERRAEAPTIEKFADGGVDPYQTAQRVLSSNPDAFEHLPHIVVTTASGSNARRTVGRVFIDHVQAPPRIVTGNAGPYALADPVAQVTDLLIVTAPAATTYSVTVGGEPVSVTVASGTKNDAADALADALRASPVGQVFAIAVAHGVAPIIRLVHPDAGVTVSVVAAAPNVSVTAVVAASDPSVTAPAMLVYRTKPKGFAEAVTSLVRFLPSRFAASEPMSSVPASAIARVFNEQALYAFARVVPVGAGFGVQLETGGRLGGETPNEIEVLSSSTPALVAALGLGVSGTAIGGGSITGAGPEMTFNLTGASFAANLAGRYLVLAGTTSSDANDGRFLITSAGGETINYVNEDGIAEALPVAATYFVGLRDDSRNADRPVMNRYHAALSPTFNVELYCESPTERRELVDLVLSNFVFFLEQQHFAFFGRGVFSEAYPDEHYVISIHQEVQAGPEQDIPRGEDTKNQIRAGRVVVPLTVQWHVDRPVLVPSGPSVGQSYTLEAENISYDPFLPLRS